MESPSAGTWAAPHPLHALHARVAVPGSKSETNRALVLAALASGPSTVRGALDARDSRLMRSALAALGVGISPLDADRVEVTPPESFACPGLPIDVGLSGNVMRFVPPLAALAPGTTRFVGDPRAAQRPVAPLLDALAQLGVPVRGDAVPFELDGGHLTGSSVRIDASASSQFVSGLLLAAARFPHGLVIRHENPEGKPVPSRPHLEMTVAMLRRRGVAVDTPDPATWRVSPGPIAARDEQIAPDLTNAAAFLAAAAMAGGEVSVPGWPGDTTQGGDRIREILARMGADVTLVDGTATVRGSGTLTGVELDLRESSELTPVVAALGAAARGTTVIRGVAHIRGHETDRLAALHDELAALGADVEETPDGLVIRGSGPEALHGGLFRTYADHRMAHAGALLGLVVEGVVLDDVACTSKTLPDFPNLWTAMVARGTNGSPA